MADFDKAVKSVIGHDGNNQTQDLEDTIILLCSNCFRDEGLKIDAYQIGIDSDEKCPKCKSTSGHKLTKKLVENLCYRFFVRGTIQKCDYGGAPLALRYSVNNIN